MKKGKLYLIPTPITDQDTIDPFAGFHLAILENIQVFIVEELRTARRFLRRAGVKSSLDEMDFLELNEHTRQEDTLDYLERALKGSDIGLISEAGLPCIADPGNLVVQAAHQKGIQVVPLLGPSSILMALMASGFNGQQFIFHGYLPVKPSERQQSLKALERDLLHFKRTQIFIEAPYRNFSLLESILRYCHPDTYLSISCDLSSPNEFISTRQVKYWKTNVPELNKRPAVFLLGNH